MKTQQTILAYDPRGEGTDFDAAVVGAGFSSMFSLRELGHSAPIYEKATK